MIKSLELSDPGSCLNKAAPDEPVFVLRAKDLKAAQAVRLWAAMAVGCHEDDKISEALALADQMDEWRGKQLSPAMPNPPGMLNRDTIAEAERKAYLARRF